MSQPVEPLNDGREAWRLGFSGFFMHVKGNVLTLAFAVLTATGVPWWWNELIPEKTEINPKFIFIVSLVIVGIVIVCGFIYLKKRSIRSLNIKYYLHQLSHSIRNEQTRINEILVINNNLSSGKLTEELERFLKEICENIKQYFSLLTMDNSVEVAIRLAVLDTGKIVYRTYARSNGLNPNRSKQSEDIAIDEGLPKFLRNDRSAQGVIIYNDFTKAEEMGAYKITTNDRTYPLEIKTAMVAPMNAWDGVKQDMIGILFITSKNDNTFSAKYVDSVAFISDIIASSISNTVNISKVDSDLKNK